MLLVFCKLFGLSVCCKNQFFSFLGVPLCKSAKSIFFLKCRGKSICWRNPLKTKCCKKLDRRASWSLTVSKQTRHQNLACSAPDFPPPNEPINTEVATLTQTEEENLFGYSVIHYNGIVNFSRLHNNYKLETPWTSATEAKKKITENWFFDANWRYF